MIFRIPKVVVVARVGMDERGWENPECGYEEKAHDSGGVDGLGSEGKAMVSFGLSGGCDGGVWDRVDDLTDQLFDVKKERCDASRCGAFNSGRAGEEGVGRACGVRLGGDGGIGGWAGWGHGSSRVFDARI
jgi:hypothetical protein